MEFIEFFAGGGGAHIGLRKAGLTPRLVVEWDSDCRETLRANDPNVAIDPADMFECTVAEVLQRHGISRDFAGLIWLSPPCQGVSNAGKKMGKYDKRNNLLYTVSAACRYAPQAWVVMEQVLGLRNKHSRPLWRKLKRQIRAAGRTKKVWILNAVDFGLAQDRPRIFMVCPPVGMASPSKPKGAWREKPPTQLWEAIHPKTGFVDPYPSPIPLRKNEAILRRGIPPGGNCKSTQRARQYIEHLWAKKQAKARAEGRDPGKMPAFRYHLKRLSWREPAYVIRASWPQAHGFHVHPCHPQEDRHLSNGECMKLQGFPLDYYIHGSERTELDSKGKKKVITPEMSVRRQIGNAVCPPVAKAIGEAILATTQAVDCRKAL